MFVCPSRVMRALAVLLPWTAMAFPGPPARASPIRIHEFSPRPVAGEGEWIELYNPDPAEISLEGWVLRDGTGRNRTLGAEARIRGGGYLLLAARPDSLRAHFSLPDSVGVVRPDGWPTLNDNNGSAGAPADVVVLVDSAAEIADSVAYFSEWLPPERGRSVERVDLSLPGSDPGAWGWSLDPSGATPGRANSLGKVNPEGPRGELQGPRSVAPASAPAVFRFELPGPGTLALWLLDREGREIAVLRAPDVAPARGLWVWGSDAPRVPRAGPYLLCLRWQGSDAGPVVRFCRSVWVES